MKYLATILLGLVLATNAIAIQYAWWLRVDYEDEATLEEIESIPLRNIDSDFLRVGLLTKKSQPPEAEKDLTPYEFTIEKDLNGDGALEKAMVGVFVTKNQKQGRFLLVLGKDKDNHWQKQYLFKLPNKAGFSVLSYNNGEGLRWRICLECNPYATLEFKNGKYRLRLTENGTNSYLD